jgi:hypothetical protein
VTSSPFSALRRNRSESQVRVSESLQVCKFTLPLSLHFSSVFGSLRDDFPLLLMLLAQAIFASLSSLPFRAYVKAAVSLFVVYVRYLDTDADVDDLLGVEWCLRSERRRRKTSEQEEGRKEKKRKEQNRKRDKIELRWKSKELDRFALG